MSQAKFRWEFPKWVCLHCKYHSTKRAENNEFIMSPPSCVLALLHCVTEGCVYVYMWVCEYVSMWVCEYVYNQFRRKRRREKLQMEIHTNYWFAQNAPMRPTARTRSQCGDMLLFVDNQFPFNFHSNAHSCRTTQTNMAVVSHSPIAIMALPSAVSCLSSKLCFFLSFSLRWLCNWPAAFRWTLRNWLRCNRTMTNRSEIGTGKIVVIRISNGSPREEHSPETVWKRRCIGEWNGLCIIVPLPVIA